MSLKDDRGNLASRLPPFVVSRKASQAENESEPVDLLAEMGHDLRASIVSVLGYADMVAQGSSVDATSRDAIRGIQGNGQHMLELVETILATARLRSGRLSGKREVASPEKLAQEVIDNLAPQARERGCNITLILGTQIPRSLSMNVICIRRVLQNLLTNAVKYGGTGRVFVHIDTEERNSGSSTLRPLALKLEVRDCGTGMSREQIQRIFEPYESEPKGQIGSFGLGLAITRRLLECLGREISVSSRLNEGTIFRVEIPVALAFEGISAPTHEHESERVLLPRKVMNGRVLVIEDDPNHQEIVRFFLEAYGVTADIESTGHRALTEDLVPYDAIVLDLQIPNLDGPSLALALRARGFDRPIFAFSAHGRDIESTARRDGWHESITRFLYKSDGLQTIAGEMASYMTANGHWQFQSMSPSRESQYERLVAEFRRKLPQTLDGIEEALDGDMKEEAARLAHRLAGSAGLYGYSTMSDIARQLQRSLENKELTEESQKGHVRELRICFQKSMDSPR